MTIDGVIDMIYDELGNETLRRVRAALEELEAQAYKHGNDHGYEDGYADGKQNDMDSSYGKGYEDGYNNAESRFYDD